MAFLTVKFLLVAKGREVERGKVFFFFSLLSSHFSPVAVGKHEKWFNN
jgi:hypothetical protein